MSARLGTNSGFFGILQGYTFPFMSFYGNVPRGPTWRALRLSGLERRRLGGLCTTTTAPRPNESRIGTLRTQGCIGRYPQPLSIRETEPNTLDLSPFLDENSSAPRRVGSQISGIHLTRLFRN